MRSFLETAEEVLMRRVDRGDPDLVEFRGRGFSGLLPAGILMILSAAFILAFTSGYFGSFEKLTRNLRNGLNGTALLLFLFGIVFSGWRKGLLIDGRGKTMATWSGLFVPMLRKAVSLENVSVVSLTKEVRRRKNSSVTVFPVKLTREGGEELQIFQGKDYVLSRRIAESVAKAIYRPMKDSSSGEVVLRQADHLDENLRERVRRMDWSVEVKPRPLEMRSRVEEKSGGIVIFLPGLPLGIRIAINVLVLLIAGAVAFFFFGASVFSAEGLAPAESVLVKVFPALFVLIPLALVLNRIRLFARPVEIRADGSRLEFREGRMRKEIPADELEELNLAGRDIGAFFRQRMDGKMEINPEMLDRPEGSEYIAREGSGPVVSPALAGLLRAVGTLAPNSLSIYARSDRASIEFGAGLSKEELEYLYSVLLSLLAA